MIAIHNQRANLAPINPIFTFTTHGTLQTTAGTGIIISGISVPTVGAVALLYNFTKAGVAQVFVA